MVNPHLDVGGWNFLFTASCLLVAIYAARLIRRELGGYVTPARVWSNPTSRMIIGFCLVATGSAIRVGGWLPWRAMLYAGNAPAHASYIELANVWSAGGVLIAYLGFFVLTQRAWDARFGRAWAWAVAAGVGASLYLTGYFGTWAGSLLF